MGVSTCPPIGNEANNKTAIDASGFGIYKDPLFSAYPVPLGNLSTPGTVAYIWRYNPGNAIPAPGWPTESWSGLDLYSGKLIPGWKRSLVAASLKWGRLVKLKLDGTGVATAPTNTVSDTVSYFNSQNRFRDLAFSADGKDIFVIMDNTSTTSGPGSANPAVPNCAGCVQKFTFLGYNSDGNGKSTISNSIDVTAGTANSCENGTTITIDNTNSNHWVPITGQDGNILAEIKANGNNLGTVTSSFYIKTGTIRETSAKKLYAGRNITITPQNQPSSSVDIRLYITAAEYNALRTATNSVGASSGVNSIGDIVILKNNDACGSALINTPITLTPQYAEAFGNNYVLQGTISSFSSFYLGSPAFGVLPLQLITFKGSLRENNTTFLQWTTSNETNSSHFVIERSTDGRNFSDIGIVAAAGGSSTVQHYSFIDENVMNLTSGVVHYRLRITDNDGLYKYSSIVVVYLSDIVGRIILSPNPAVDETRVNFKAASSGRVQWKLLDNNGRVIIQRTIHINKGNNNFIIKLNGLPAGVYHLNVSGAGVEQNTRLQKL